jgi:subtilisin-like proprotein convertase family protein
MKSRLLICCFGVMLALTAQAGIIYRVGGTVVDNNAINATIPDGSAIGWSGTATTSGYADRYVGTVSVSLNLSGGYNGDLYAYLSSGSVLVPLLNRVGVGGSDAFGYGTAGMQVTLANTSPTDYADIHTTLSPTLNGYYSPDGRNIDPQSTPAQFDSASRVNFNAFNAGGVSPNGTWTLFFADLSAGATSQLVSWELNITSSAVPEPVNVALMVFGGAFGLVALVRSRKLQNLFRRATAH